MIINILANKLSSFETNISTDLWFLNDFIPKFEEVANLKQIKTNRLFDLSASTEVLATEKGSQGFLFCSPVLINEPYIINTAFLWNQILPDKHHPFYNYFIGCLTAVGSFFFLNQKIFEQARRFVFLLNKFILIDPEKMEVPSTPSHRVYVFPPLKAVERLRIPSFSLTSLGFEFDPSGLFQKSSLELLSKNISEPGILLYLHPGSFDYLVNFFVLRGFAIATTNPIIAQTFKGSVFLKNIENIPEALSLATKVKKTEGLKFDNSFLDHLANTILENLTKN